MYYDKALEIKFVGLKNSENSPRVLAAGLFEAQIMVAKLNSASFTA
jgi:hypothetical protein